MVLRFINIIEVGFIVPSLIHKVLIDLAIIIDGAVVPSFVLPSFGISRYVQGGSHTKSCFSVRQIFGRLLIPPRPVEDPRVIGFVKPTCISRPIIFSGIGDVINLHSIGIDSMIVIVLKPALFMCLPTHISSDVSLLRNGKIPYFHGKIQGRLWLILPIEVNLYISIICIGSNHSRSDTDPKYVVPSGGKVR